MCQQALLEAGCLVNLTDKAGCTALHYACQSATGVELLLAAGANINVVDADGNTPLLMAASEGLSRVVCVLAKTGRCDVNIATSTLHRTPLHLLAYKGHVDCIPDLIAADVDIHACDAEGRSALWYAVANKHLHIVKLLLRAHSHAHTFRCLDHLPRSACPVSLAFSRKLVCVLKLFILTGYDRGHLRDSLAMPEAVEVFGQAGLQHWLQHAQSVMSLRCMCRIWIRHHLGQHVHRSLPQLPLPPPVRDYLFLSDLDDEHN